MKIILTEIAANYGLPIIVGQVDVDVKSEIEANEKAREYARVLSEVRQTKVSYFLQNETGIIANIDLSKKKPA